MEHRGIARRWHCLEDKTSPIVSIEIEWSVSCHSFATFFFLRTSKLDIAPNIWFIPRSLFGRPQSTETIGGGWMRAGGGLEAGTGAQALRRRRWAGGWAGAEWKPPEPAGQCRCWEAARGSLRATPISAWIRDFTAPGQEGHRLLQPVLTTRCRSCWISMQEYTGTIADSGRHTHKDVRLSLMTLFLASLALQVWLP